jgi:hypothetical protein
VVKEELSDVLSEFARTMVTNFPIQGILDHLVRRIVDILPVTAAGVTLIAPGVEPRYVAASDPSALRYEKLQTSLGEGPCLAAFETGESVYVPDLRRADGLVDFAPQALEAGLAAVFASRCATRPYGSARWTSIAILPARCRGNPQSQRRRWRMSRRRT